MTTLTQSNNTQKLVERAVTQFDAVRYLSFTPVKYKPSNPPEHTLYLPNEFFCKLGKTKKKVNCEFLKLFSKVLNKKYGSNSWHFTETIGVMQNGKYVCNFSRDRNYIILNQEEAIMLASFSALKGPKINERKFSVIYEADETLEGKKGKRSVNLMGFRGIRF